ncbi:MAG TPA: hypothetical protein EYP14_12585, partial [Planctomycetaceae bacterium]|nr:hypothetical protein [Planctomycetaceae bacterium]
MRAFAKVTIGLALMALLAVPVAAAQKGEGEKGKKRGRHQRPVQLQILRHWLKDIELTEDQKAKVDELQKEFAPKFAELRKGQAAIFTPEQKQARREALRKAKAEGKKFREAVKEIEKAINLTD